MKEILILGGTNFIGRVLVEKLQHNPDYRLTLFNRGKHNAGLFAGIPKIYGDRETDDLFLIARQKWDCIIDCSGYYPNTFAKLLDAVEGKVGRYIFISTISVFNLGNVIGRTVTEDEEILPCTDEQKESPFPNAYGEKKAEMERLLMSHSNLDSVILRPSLVYGRYDPTDRFYYWLWRAKSSDRVLVPDNGSDSVSITYVEDLAELIIASIDVRHHRKVYNAVTHDVTLKQIVETCANQLGNKPEIVRVPAQRILNAGLFPWRDVPLWMNGDLKIASEKVKQDFKPEFTSFAKSVRDTAAYYEDLGWPDCKYGMSKEKEASLLRMH